MATTYTVIGVTQGASTGSATLATAAFAADPVTGDTILVGVSTWRSGWGVTHSAPTDTAGNTYTQVGTTVNHVGGNLQVSLWRCVGATGGSSFVVTDHVSPSTYNSVIAWCVRPSTTILYNSDVASTTSAIDGTDPTTSPAPPAADAFFLSVAVAGGADNTLAAGTGWNALANGFDAGMATNAKYGLNSVGSVLYTEYRIAATALQGLWDDANNSNIRALIVASFGPAGSSGITGTGDETFARPALAGSGTAVFVTGTGTVTLGHPALAGNSGPFVSLVGGTGGTAIGPPRLGGAGGLAVPPGHIFVPVVRPDFDFYSDHDMQCPGSWYGGFKEARVTKFGEAERTLSDPWTGEWQGSTFSLSLSDYDLSIRQRFLSPTDRYWTQPLAVRMTTRANRAALGVPYTVFVGTLLDAQPTRPLAWDLTLSDIVSQGLLSDQFQIPWRLIRDGFLASLTEIFPDLDRTAPEPIIYGEHRRAPDVDAASPEGFRYVPTYLGVETLSLGSPGTPEYFHVWLVCGHACADITNVYAENASVLADEGTDWLIPHFGGFNALFGGPYVDKRSSAYGNDRRYTLIYGLVGATGPDNCAGGAGWGGTPARAWAAPAANWTLTVSLEGIEPVGDGSGAMLGDRLDQYKHFVLNYVAHQGQDSYQSGAWLTNPDWTLFDGAVPVVEESSFDACRTIAEGRLPAVGSPATTPGYIGAAIIGARGQRESVRKWLADWNRSCGVRFGITHFGQIRVVMLHPTAAIKAAAPLFTDAYEMLEGSFNTPVRWDQHANRIPWKADYEYVSGQFKTSGVAVRDESVLNYGREIPGEEREYPFAPGVTMANHLAQLEVLQRQHPPRLVVWEGTVSPDGPGILDLGDYFRYRHFAAVATAPSEIRLAQIQKHQVQVGSRRVRIEAIDCEDLINYDAVPEGIFDFFLHSACEDAIPIESPGLYQLTVDTTTNGTDDHIALGILPGDGIAYHAAWWTYHPLTAELGQIQTGSSDYDTVLSVWRVPHGDACAGMELVDLNDNVIPLLRTSEVDLLMDSYYDYYFLVTGYGATDCGTLVFTFFSEEPPPP